MVAEKTLNLRRQGTRITHRDERFLGEVGNADFLAIREGVSLSYDEQQWFSQEWFNRETRVFDRECHHGEVELTLDHRPHQGVPEVFPGVDQEVRVFGPTLCDQGRHQIRHNRRDRTDGDAPVEGRMIAQFLGRIFYFEQNPASAFNKGRTRFGENCLPPQTMKQFMPNLALKIYNLLA